MNKKLIFSNIANMTKIFVPVFILFAFVAFPFSTSAQTTVNLGSFPIDPKGTIVYANMAAGTPDVATLINLDQLASQAGLSSLAGYTLIMNTEGNTMCFFSAAEEGKDNCTITQIGGMLGAFTSNTIENLGEINPLPNAIASTEIDPAGNANYYPDHWVAVDTYESSAGGPPDFSILVGSPTSVVVPAGAHFLAASVIDSSYSDNSDPNGTLKINIQVVIPAATPTNTPPIITLLGANPFSLTVNTPFVDPGATATDTEDGNLTSKIVETGSVNASTTGTYILTYSVTDSGGLSASTTRTVIVNPSNNGGGCTTGQVATGSVHGANATLTIPAGACPMKISFSSYSHQGTIIPFEDQILTDNITNTYNPGTYNLGPLTLTCNWQTDLYGGEVQTHLNHDNGHSNLIAYDYVEHQNCNLSPTNTPPIITLLGANPFSLTVNTPFVDPGATATDTEDGNLTSKIVETGSVNASTTGTYILTYSVTDSGGLSASTTRTVIVNPVVCTENCGGGHTPDANLTVIKTADKTTFNAGDTVTYTITLKNNGPDDATGVIVTDILNSGLNFVSATVSLGSYATTTGVWTIGNLNNTASTTLTIVATIKDISQGQTIPNTATTTATQNDSTPGDNTSTVNVVVNPVVCTSNCNPSPQVPVVSLNANPQTITQGASSTLSWSSQNTNSCSAIWTTATSTSGTLSVSPSSTTDYVITCTGSNGSATATTTITVNTPATPPVNPPANNGGGGGGGAIGGHRHPVVVGEILGATSCSYLRDYLKIDWQNDPIEVLKLQSFLNVFEKENLSLTGVFNQATFEAVERFQTKYSEDILIPWGPKVTKGFVYILTKKKVNEIYCNTIYPLSQTDQNEINEFKSLGANISGGVEQSTGNTSGYQSQSISVENISKGTMVTPVVNLTSSSSNNSIVRNVAISLFALSQKISNNGKYLIILLILFIIAIAVARLLTGSKKDNKKESSPDKESPVIILPGTLPDEEIIIENPDEVEEF